MADRIALIDQGALQQLATPAQLVEQPASEFVAAFLGRHRLQLYLLTKKLKDIISLEQDSSGSTARPEQHLDADISLIGALDMFRQTGSDVLPVCAGQVLLGSISRKRLQDVIAESMCAACSG
jgi:osmoprotectant transport system ATP-binding protein